MSKWLGRRKRLCYVEHGISGGTNGFLRLGQNETRGGNGSLSQESSRRQEHCRRQNRGKGRRRNLAAQSRQRRSDHCVERRLALSTAGPRCNAFSEPDALYTGRS